MSSVQVDHPAKVGHNKKENEKSRKLFNSSHKKHKHEDNRHFKFGRKRSQSFTGNGKFFPPYKRRKKEGMIIPPTKFLLGGNIRDPLNLNSMQDEEVNRALNAVTPKSSPLPTPKHKKEVIEVIIPPNICDPLNLNNCNDNDTDEYEKQLVSPTKKGSKRRNRKRKRANSSCGKDDRSDDNNTEKSNTETSEETTTPESEGIPVSIEANPVPSTAPSQEQSAEPKTESPRKDKNKLRLKGLDELKDKRMRKLDVKDKIVSPVIPQPGAWKSRPQHRPSQDKKKKSQPIPNFREKNARYQYGNYNRYYGYRNQNQDVDTRLTVFVQRKELFFGKDILDIGCNIGHITLLVARDLGGRSVTGIDIDRTLINIARKNIKHYVNCVRSPASNEDGAADRRDADSSFFPMSMPINYGPIDVPGFKDESHKGFPYNVTFVQGNYVLEDDALLCSEQPQFDTILCLSITKWIHLNFGDAGLKQAFRRMYAQLRPGGVLVLEPQEWGTYNKRKKLTERIFKNYQSIEFRPHKFTQYLLQEVGFSKCEVLSIPPHPSKGFQRPIQLFTKPCLEIQESASTSTIKDEQENLDIKTQKNSNVTNPEIQEQMEVQQIQEKEEIETKCQNNSGLINSKIPDQIGEEARLDNLEADKEKQKKTNDPEIQDNSTEGQMEVQEVQSEENSAEGRGKPKQEDRQDQSNKKIIDIHEKKDQEYITNIESVGSVGNTR